MLNSSVGRESSPIFEIWVCELRFGDGALELCVDVVESLTSIMLGDEDAVGPFTARLTLTAGARDVTFADPLFAPFFDDGRDGAAIATTLSDTYGAGAFDTPGITTRWTACGWISGGEVIVAFVAVLVDFDATAGAETACWLFKIT